MPTFTRREALRLAASGIGGAAAVTGMARFGVPLLVSPAEAATNSWTHSPLAAGFFRSFAFPTNGNVRVLAGSDDSGGVWGSDDDGVTWSLKTAAFPNHTGWTLATGIANQQIVYSGDQYGRVPVLKSTNRGSSWTSIGDGLTGFARRVNALAVSRVSDGVVYAGTGAYYKPGDGVWKYAGGAWSPVGTNLGGHKTPFLVVVKGTDAQGDFDIPIVAVVDSCAPQISAGLYWLYPRNATTWQKFPVDPPPPGSPPLPGIPPAGDPASLALGYGDELLYGVVPSNPDPNPIRTYRYRYSGEFTPVGKSVTDMFFPWDFISGGLTPDGKLVYLANSIYGAPPVDADQTVWRGEDTTGNGDFDWVPCTGLESDQTIGLGRNPTSGKIFAGQLTNSGIYTGTVSGGTISFTRSTSGPNAAEITSLAARADGRVLATLVGNYQGVGTGNRPADGGNVNALAISTDNGQTWRRPATPVRAHGLSVTHATTAPGYVLLGTFRRGMWLSGDGGESFAQIGTPGIGDGDSVSAVAFIPYTWGGVNYDVALASVTVHTTGAERATCTSPGMPGGIRTQIMRSLDYGATWQVVLDEKTANAFVAGVDLDPGANVVPRIWAPAYGEVRWSDDLGATWTSKTTSWNLLSALPSATDAKKCLFGTERSGSSEPVILDVSVDSQPPYPTLAVATGRSMLGINALRLDGARLFAGFNGAEFAFTEPWRDGGVFYLDPPYTGAWTALETGLTVKHVRAMATAGDGRILVGTYGGGVYRGQA